MKSTTEIIKESEKAEGTVLDILIKNGCSKEDLEKVSIMCATIGFSKKTAYKMLNLICESEEYKSSNVSKVICGAKQVPISMFTNVFPEFKKACKEMWG